MVCSDCPPFGYSTDETRCKPCPRRSDETTIRSQELLVRWADTVESGGPKTSVYYRLLPKIKEAREAISHRKKMKC